MRLLFTSLVLCVDEPKPSGIKLLGSNYVVGSIGTETNHTM